MLSIKGDGRVYTDRLETPRKISPFVGSTYRVLPTQLIKNLACDAKKELHYLPLAPIKQ